MSKYDLSDLKELYIDKSLSGRQIANDKGCSTTAVFYRLRKMGIPVRGKSEAFTLLFKTGQLKRPTGRESSRWKGGIMKSSGYIYILQPNHPYAQSTGYVAEHRLVVERKLGRYLEPNEHIHHLNGISNDNRPQNLAIVGRRSHPKYTYIRSLQQRIRELEVIVAQHRLL